jgi:ribonuclease P protein component
VTTDASFGRNLRLTGQNDFQQVFDAPQGKSIDHCFIILARANSLACPRLGLAISKRKIRKAVARNRIKRLVRESFRCHQQLLAGLDIVVMAKPQAENLAGPELSVLLSRHWSQLVRRCAAR